MRIQTTVEPFGNSAGRQSCVPGPDLATATEAELSAFYSAVKMSDGASLADAAVELWLQIFASADIDVYAPTRRLRRVTIEAASLLAEKNLQHA